MNANDAVPCIWTTGTTEVFKTGTWRSALPQHIHAPSPCHAACPVEGDIAEWIGRARARDFRGAWEILTRHNPFPAVAGRICHHPCEAACNRAGFDDALAICRLERHVGDRALAEGWAFAPIEARRDERIAIVGGGPSGLSAAFHLRRRGYAVTLFESRPELGGLMRYGIPSYRLARSVLDGEIARIVALGIDLRCGESMATAEDFERLRTEFDAVYLAIGARCQKRLPRLDYTRPWVMDGADYLAQANAGAPPALGKRVVVIGGGSAALDVARSARRAGHDVTILALESAGADAGAARGSRRGAGGRHRARRRRDADRGDRRGQRGPLAQVRARPVRGRCGARAVHGDADRRQRILARGGRHRAVDRAGSRARAAGRRARPRRRARQGRPRIRRRASSACTPAATSRAWRASSPRRSAWASAPRTRSTACCAGARKAATPTPRDGEPVVPLAAINTFYYPAQARAAEERLPVAQRLASDAEVQLGFDLDGALAETERCFSCGTCIQCDNCVHYCPDLAVQREAGGYVVLTDYCKGCGICVKECPTGVDEDEREEQAQAQ